MDNNLTMSTLGWCLLFIANSIFSWWIIGFGGAKWVEGWKSAFFVGWLALDWNAEQIRLYMLIVWITSIVWFILGLIEPEIRLI